jgi:hypothetical protein
MQELNVTAKYLSSKNSNEQFIYSFLSQTKLLQQTILMRDASSKRFYFRNYHPLLSSLIDYIEIDYPDKDKKFHQYLSTTDTLLSNNIISILDKHLYTNGNNINKYYFSYNLLFKKNNGTAQMVHFKVFPIYIFESSKIKNAYIHCFLMEPAHDDTCSGMLTLHEYETKKKTIMHFSKRAASIS